MPTFSHCATFYIENSLIFSFETSLLAKLLNEPIRDSSNTRREILKLMNCSFDCSYTRALSLSLSANKSLD